MNNSQDSITQARSLLEQSKEVLIALPANPSFDTVASALSLYLGLSLKGIQISVVCPDQMTVGFSHLVGVDKITTNVSSGNGKNLVISFPYQEGSIEKVSYNIENETFNLVIEPREGYPNVTQDVIRFSQSGGNTDLLITIGVSQLANLTQLSQTNPQILEKPVINIDTGRNNSMFGKVNFVDSNISSISELTLGLLSNLGITLNADIATNLLAGIVDSTNNFNSPQTQASTYEAAALCLRSGARKIVQSTNSFKEQPFKPVKQTQFQQQPVNQSFQKPPVGIKPQQKPRLFTPSPQPQFNQTVQNQPQVKKQNEAPPDWLKPKIYKGSTLL